MPDGHSSVSGVNHIQPARNDQDAIGFLQDPTGPGTGIPVQGFLDPGRAAARQGNDQTVANPVKNDEKNSQENIGRILT